MTADDQGIKVKDWLIGVDVGGTFTDGVLLRPGCDPIIVKTPTNIADPVAGLLGCLDALGESVSISKRDLLARTIKLGYGTTQAANLIVEGKGSKVGFITTRGFKDTLIIAEIGRERIGMDLTHSRAPSLVPRSRIYEVRERVDSQGKELAPVNLDDVKAAMDSLAAVERGPHRPQPRQRPQHQPPEPRPAPRSQRLVHRREDMPRSRRRHPAPRFGQLERPPP